LHGRKFVDTIVGKELRSSQQPLHNDYSLELQPDTMIIKNPTAYFAEVIVGEKKRGMKIVRRGDFLGGTP